MTFTIEQIATLLQGEIVGDKNITISMLSKIEEGSIGSISFLSNPKYEQYIYTTKASVVIVNRQFVPKKKVETTLIKVDDPYTSFTVLLGEYERLVSLSITGVEEPSFLGKDSNIGPNHYRGAFSYIGKGAAIGKNVKIYPHVFIGDNVRIGDNTVLHPGVKIYSRCVVGNYCTIHAGTVVGSDGFGFAPQGDGTYKKIPQVGNVVIKDHVEIGANTVIDCATMGSTIIQSGVKLDNLIQIAHNVEIGENTVIAAQSGISGSSKIGKQSVIAGQVGIAGHLSVAPRTTLLAQSGLSKSVKEEGSYLFGAPAFDRANYIRSYTIFRKLPDLQARIEQLEEKILSLAVSEAK